MCPVRRLRMCSARALPGLIGKIYFPKTMYWTGKGGARFIRPIRWIVALLGESVVPFEFAGVKSGNLTDGHRILGKAQHSGLDRNIRGHVEEQRRAAFGCRTSEPHRQRVSAKPSFLIRRCWKRLFT